MEQPKETPKMKVAAMIVALLFLVVLISGLTYAIFQFKKLGDTENEIRVGSFVMKIDDETAQEINLTSQYPITNEDGLAQVPYTFTIQNDGDISATYRLRLKKDEESYPKGLTNVDSSYIKYGLKKPDGTTSIGFVDDNEGILISDRTLSSGESETYSITVWIDCERDIPNSLFDEKTIEFYGKVQLEAIQEGHTDYTTGK